MGSIMMNFSANMLGLDNAATPLGLKAMKELQEVNPDKEKASDPQDHVSGAQYFQPDHHSHQHSGHACCLRCQGANRCVHSHDPGHLFFHHGRVDLCFHQAENQPVE